MFIQGITDVSKSTDIFLNFLIFLQDMRALPEAPTCTEPAGEIRGGLHKKLSHSQLGPKTTYYKSWNCEKLVLFALLLYVPSQQLWSLRDGQFT